MNTAEKHESALHVIHEQIESAVATRKCHRCGCLQATVKALSSTPAGQHELAPILLAAKKVFVPKEYDCLGCSVCYPAIAANAFADAYPDAGAQLDLCPTEEPEARSGWPPLPGNYHVIRYQAPVAVCTLNSTDLAGHIRDSASAGLAVAGTMQTENLGIERVIRNLLANPNVRFLILGGEDTRQRIGHLPGQSLVSLFHNGLDERSRIMGAQGKRPVLKNVTTEEVRRFKEQVTLVDLIGELRADVISERIRDCAARNPGPIATATALVALNPIQADEPTRLVLDPAGYFVVYPDARRHSLMLEHYSNAGVLDCLLEGHSAAPLYTAAIVRSLISQLDHAAYLGRELARAEHSLKTGEPYVQDRAPGELPVATPITGSSVGAPEEFANEDSLDWRGRCPSGCRGPAPCQTASASSIASTRKRR
jgi:tetrahydromethanopterin S-methyltransferase subunit A